MTTRRLLTASLALFGLFGVLLVPSVSGAARAPIRPARVILPIADRSTSARPVVQANGPRVVVPSVPVAPAVSFRGFNFDRLIQRLQLVLARIRNDRVRERLRIVFCRVFGDGFCTSP
jgi:hypothetical protein